VIRETVGGEAVIRASWWGCRHDLTLTRRAALSLPSDRVYRSPR
jgi:hypothetical protein